MGDHEFSTIKHSDHLLLDQPLLRLPSELLRKNFRSAHFTIEKDTSALKTLLKDSATAAVSGRASQQDVLRSLDSMLARMRGVKRKLANCADEEARLHAHAAARIAHLDELYAMTSVDDVKYEAWSRKRLDRLLADYLLRHGYNESAKELAQQRGMENLVDMDTFVTMSRIRDALINGSVAEALSWCTDNKKELRKMESKLEFMLRFQQYIELVRTQSSTKLTEGIAHAKKHLIPFRTAFPREVQQACGLLAFPPSSPASAAYADLYKPSRWTDLANLFTTTHNNLLALPAVPLLHVALSSGLSALKTPACHAHSSPDSSSASSDPAVALASTLGHGVCPICSTELNELARNVPYAHHTKSHVEHDLRLLPNGCVYGKDRLELQAKKGGLPADQVKDLRTGEVFQTDDLKKVFIT
ncbi:CTLH/CRA C-terminal to lish motif domain-containing protein [Dactylonectria estremocensis]|uniref:CTLH/CRA C-terminal to lish motif domain-containing protein n=1 Tax=Dactylonectria estremocensis TaxID=1079267 RepID=A0A9P9FDZ4_9HYPO|nr:CTLH/CRA C-terminal to lish motif domain-containing protein [Dactylonectria estremocensis]